MSIYQHTQFGSQSEYSLHVMAKIFNQKCKFAFYGVQQK